MRQYTCYKRYKIEYEFCYGKYIEIFFDIGDLLSLPIPMEDTREVMCVCIFFNFSGIVTQYGNRYKTGNHNKTSTKWE